MAESVQAGDVLARLQLDVSQYLQGLQQATQATQQFQQRMGQLQLPTPGLNTQAWQSSLTQAGQQYQHFTAQQQQATQRLQQYFTGLTSTLGQVVPGLGAVGQAVGSMGQQFQQLTTTTAASSVGLTAWIGAAAGIAGAAAAAAVAVVSLTRSMGDFGLELQKEHAATGIALRDLQDLQKVAATVGEGPESIAQMNRILQRRVAEAVANPSSQAAGVFQQLFGARTGAVLQQGQDPQQYLAFLSEVAQAYQRLSLADRDLFATFLQGRSFQAVALVMQELAKGPGYIRQHGEALHASYDDATIARMAEAGRRLNTLTEAAKLLVLVDLPDWMARTFGPELEQDAANIATVTEALQKLYETAQKLAGVGAGGKAPGIDRGYLEGGIPGLSEFTSPGEGPLAALPSAEQALVRRYAAVSRVDPQFLAALRRTEAGGPGREFGVLSVPAPTIEDQARIAAETIAAQQRRFEAAGGQAVDPQTGRYTEAFIRAFSAVYAPIGAANDPRNLNAAHAANLLRFYGLGQPGAAAPAAPAAPVSTEEDARAAVESRRTAQERQVSAATELELRQKSLEQLTALYNQEREDLLQLRVRNEELRRGPEAAAQLRRQLQQEQIQETEQFERQRRQAAPGEQADIYIRQIQTMGQATHDLRLSLATLEQEPAFRVLRGETQLFGEGLQEAQRRLQVLRQQLEALLREPQLRPEVGLVEQAVRQAEQDVQRRTLAAQLGAQAAQEAREVRLATLREEVAQVEGRPQTQLEEQARIRQEQARRAQSRAEVLTTQLTGLGLTREQQGRLEEVVGGVAGGLMGAAPGAETLRQIGAVPLDRMIDAVRVLQDLREGTLDLTQALEALQQLHVFDEESLHRLERMRDVEVDRAQRLEREARVYQERAQIVRAQEALTGQVAERREQLAATGGTLEQQRQAALVQAQVRALTQQGIRPALIQEALPGLRQTAVEIDRLGTALLDAQRPLQQFAESYESTFVKVQEVTLQALQKTESALVDFFSTGRFNAAQLFQGIVRDFNQLAVHTLITRPLAGLADQLFQGLRGNAPEIGGLSAVTGGGLPLAGGGLVTRPTMALLGEAGPELVLPLRAMAEGGVVSELGGAVGAGAGGALGALLLAPPDLQKAQAIYAERFRAWTDQATGDLYVGSVDASKNITWASKVPGAVGYLAEPQEEGAGRQAGRALLSLVGSLAGAYAGGRLGRAQQGAVLRGPTMLLAGEAGAEAIIPLRHGGIPVSLDGAGRPVSRLPSGVTIPLLPMPRLADGGVIAGAPMPPTWSGPATSAAPWTSTPPALHLTMNVHGVQDTQGFRATQSQIMRGAALAFQREWSRNL